MWFYDTPPLTKANYFANALDIGTATQREDEHRQDKNKFDRKERLNFFWDVYGRDGHVPSGDIREMAQLGIIHASTAGSILERQRL